MITVNDILTKINELVAAKFTGVAIYINYCPKGFLRPSFLIRCKDIKRDDVNRSTVTVTAGFTITCFADTDEYNHSDIEELAAWQNNVLDIFRGGYITVGDRAIKVKTSTGTTDTDISDEVRINLGDRAIRLSDAAAVGMDSAMVNLKFEYFDDRTDKTETEALMGSLAANTSLK